MATKVLRRAVDGADAVLLAVPDDALDGMARRLVGEVTPNLPVFSPPLIGYSPHWQRSPGSGFFTVSESPMPKSALI